MRRPLHDVVPSAVALGLLALAGCGGPRHDVVRSSTSEAWASDAYAHGTGPQAQRARAARVLDRAPEPIDPPIVMQVGASATVLFDGPSLAANPLARLARGTAVRMVERARFVRVPEGALMRECSPGDAVPTWVRVEAGASKGWLSARSLVSPSIAGLGSDALSAHRLAAQGVLPPPPGAGLPQRKGADDAAADGLLAIAAQPCAFDGTAAAIFAPAPRLSALPPAGGTLEKLDPAIAKEVADAIAEEAAAPLADPPEPEASLYGMWQRIANAPDEKQVDIAVQDVLGDLMGPAPFTPTEERMLGRACLAARLGGATLLAADDPAVAYVNWVGNRLVAAGSLPYPVLGTLFAVVDDRGRSQCASVPGGVVMVTTGLLRSLRSEHELAAVLGREVARLEERLAVAAVLRGEGRRLNAALQVRALLASGKLDAILAKSFEPLPESQRADAVSKAHARLDSASILCIAAAVDDALRAVDAPTLADEGAVDVRAMSLMRACGWDPAALDAVLARWAATPAATAELDARRVHAAKAAVLLPPAEFPAAVGERWKRFMELLGK